MKKRKNNSARATALQITLSFALLSLVAILFASSFKAAAPAKQDGFYPPLPVPASALQGGFYPPLQASPTPTPCLNYTYTVGTGSIVPGTIDTGNHADDG